MTAWLQVSTRSDGVLVAPEGPLVEDELRGKSQLLLPGYGRAADPAGERVRILRSTGQSVGGGEDRGAGRAGADLLRIR